MGRQGLMDDAGYNFFECDGECEKCSYRDECEDSELLEEEDEE